MHVQTFYHLKHQLLLHFPVLDILCKNTKLNVHCHSYHYHHKRSNIYGLARTLQHAKQLPLTVNSIHLSNPHCIRLMTITHTIDSQMHSRWQHSFMALQRDFQLF